VPTALVAVQPAASPPAPTPIVAAPPPPSAPRPAPAASPPVSLPPPPALPAPPAPVEAAPVDTARTWTLDPAASRLVVEVRHDPGTALASLAHDHVVAATGWSGSVTWDPADPGRCVIAIDVPVAGLRVADDSPADDKAKITANFSGPRQLDGATFPTITFRSTSCAADGRVTGDLAIHGVTRRITVPMRISTADDRFEARGGFVVSTGDFGFEPFTAAMGAIRNADPLTFTVVAVGR
jgi:polyisoprenoid-binding protein YceI